MLCAPSNCQQTFLYHTKMAAFKYFHVLSIFFLKELGMNSEKCIE